MMGKKMSGGVSSKVRNSQAPGPSIARSNSKSSTSAAQDANEGLALCHIKSADNFKMLPRYSAALGRPHDDSMPAEDLDAIQQELELLLSSVAQRSRALRQEANLLERGGSSSDEVQATTSKRDLKKGKYLEKQPTSPGKRKRGSASDEKKLKDKYFGSTHKISKIKHNSVAHSPVPSGHPTDDCPDGSSFLVPNKFWLSVEPYCMPISHEDIKLLDDLIAEYSGPLVPAIPDLGPHYSSQWAAEDLKEEQDSSNPNAKANKRFTSGSSTEVAGIIKKGEKSMGEQVTGPLTQRLMAAFLEEKIMQPGDAGVEIAASAAASMAPPDSLRAMKNGISLERRLKQELIEQNLMSEEDFGKESDDEVLSEIVRVRTELSTIAEYNYTELQSLLALSKNEMKRLEVKRQLDVVDQKIVEMYKNIVAIKKKRRVLTDSERAEVFRLTEEQKRLSDILETFNVTA